MNVDFPQNEREQLEAKLTALLLGELPVDEAIEIGKAMEQNPKLAALYERLKVTIGLVRESASNPAIETVAQTQPLKLSNERREKLLTQFKTVAPKEFAKPTPKISPLLQLAAVLVLVGLLAALLLPLLAKSKVRGTSASVTVNLRMLEMAKQQWAEDNKKSGDAAPTLQELKPYLGRGESGLPSVVGEAYVPGKVSEPAMVETSSAEAKKLIGHRAVTTTAVDNGKVQFSLLPQPPPAQVAEQTSPVLVPASPTTASVPKTEIVLPANGQSAPSRDPEWIGQLERSQSLTTNNGFATRYAYISPQSGQALDGAIHGQSVVVDPDTHNLIINADSADIRQAVDRIQETNLIVWGASKSNDQVPILGDLPNVGHLFRSETKLADSNGKFDTGLTRDDMGGLRYVATNTVETLSLADSGGEPTQKNEIFLPVQQSVLASHSTIVANSGSMPTRGFGGGGGGAGADASAIEIRRGTAPSPGALEMAKAAHESAIQTSQLVQDGKVLYQLGKLDEADSKMKEALNQEPNNQAALYYESLVKQGRDRQVVDARNVTSMNRMVNVEKGWADNAARKQLPVQLPAQSDSISANQPQGLRYVTGLDLTAEMQVAIKNYLRSNGVDMDSPGKSVFFNDRTGTLTVHGTDEDLDKVQAAIDALNAPKVTGTIKSIGPITGVSETQKTDAALPKSVVIPLTPQPEILTRENSFSTFSLNVSDVSFKLAAASLEKGQMPEPASIRSEEFINAFNYRDPDAGPGVPIAFASERARYPFAHNRELLRFSLKTAAAGRQAGRPLNIVLLLDNSGSMERADRVRIIQEALRVLASQLQKADTFSIVTFARTATLRVDGVRGDQAAAAAAEIAKLTPEGGTNLGDALDLAYETARHHYLANGDNRVVLLTDGAANLGDVKPDVLKLKVEAHRKQGIALDCFGIGWEDYNDDLLEVLTRNGDGRYGFLNKPEEASTEFVSQIAGALHVAAADVKVQVEFNPKRVTSYRQIGYAKHQLTKEQFRDNTVDAAEIAAQEAGNALYTIETNPQGEGSIATVRVRYKVPTTGEYREQAWDVPYTGSAIAMDQVSPAMRLATTASAFSEWLATSPFAAEVTTDQLLRYLNGVPKIYGADTRPAKLEWMIRQAKSISGK